MNIKNKTKLGQRTYKLANNLIPGGTMLFSKKPELHLPNLWPNYFSKVNLAITRSGSSVLAELINARIPFISIPLPTSADDHQLKNAIFYKNKNFNDLMYSSTIGKICFEDGVYDFRQGKFVLWKK